MRGVYERDKGSNVWWIRWTDGAGTKRREKVGRKSDAQRLLDKRRTEVLQQKKLPEQYRAKVPFNELCNDALEHSKATNRPKATRDLGLKVAVLRSEFGEKDARTISRQELVRWLGCRANEREWSPATQNRWQVALSLIFRVGVDNQKIDVNPLAGVKQRSEDNSVHRWLTDEEEGRLVAAVRKRCPENLPALLISLHSGMRKGEQFSLRWNQVDLERRIISLSRTKNNKPRFIPINDVALAAFRQIPHKSFFVFPCPRQFKGRDAKENTPVLDPKGWFNAALKEAKIEGYTWHCNRHTFASRLVMAGVDIRTVGELLGHSVLQMTMRYSHLAPAHNAAAVAKLAKATDTKADTG